MKQVFNAFNNQPLVFVKDRNYLVTPLLDHCPATSFLLVKDVIQELNRLVKINNIDKIIGEEDRGGYLTAIFSYQHKLPFSLAKWNACGLIGENAIDFRNAYTNGKMYLNGIKTNDRVIVVEDIIDSGGTVIALINLLKMAKAKIIDIIAVAEKVEYQGVARIYQETGFKVKHLLKFSSTGKTSKVVWVNSSN